MLTSKGGMAAVQRFFDKVMGANGDPDKVTMDKCGVNKAAIDRIIACRAGLNISTTLRSRTIAPSSW